MVQVVAYAFNPSHRGAEAGTGEPWLKKKAKEKTKPKQKKLIGAYYIKYLVFDFIYKAAK